MGKMSNRDEQQRYLRILAEAAAMPALQCGVRACRRAQCCVGPLSAASTPICFSPKDDFPEELLDFFKLATNITHSFLGKTRGLDWLHTADPAQLFMAEKAVTALLPARKGKHIRRWLAQAYAQPKPAPAPALTPPQQQAQQAQHEARRYDQPQCLDEIWRSPERGQQIGSETIIIHNPDGSRTAFVPGYEARQPKPAPQHTAWNSTQTHERSGTPKARLL